MKKSCILIIYCLAIVFIGTVYGNVEYPKAKGDLVFRDSNGTIYGRENDWCFTAVLHPGHVGIYIGDDKIIHALGYWDGIKKGFVGEVIETPLSLTPGERSFYSDDSGNNKIHNSLGAKTHSDLQNNPKANALRDMIVQLAFDQKGEGYDNNFSQQKGPDSDDWTCCGLVEKIYESCASDALIFHPNYGDEDLYAGGLNITPDGHEYHFFNTACYWQTDVEFSQILASEIPLGRTFQTGEELPRKYIFFPYTQFLQPTLTDSFLPDFYLLSGTLADANGSPLRGYIYAYETSGANLGNHVYSSDGTYEMALFPGTYRIYAKIHNTYPGGYYYLNTPYETLTVNANTTLNITGPSYELYYLTGKVTDANDVGLPNINVHAHSGICQSYATTDSYGNYNALLAQGTYSLRFTPPADSIFLEKKISGFQVNSNISYNIALNSTESILSGTLIDTNQNPATGWWVYADEVSGAELKYLWSYDGTYQMPLLSSIYRIYAYAFSIYYSPNFSYTRILTPYQTVSVSGNTHCDIQVPSHDSYHLSGKVTDINDIAQPHVTINALDNNYTYYAYTQTDSGGNYDILLPSGIYKLTITAPPATYPPFEIQNLQISGDSVRNIRLSLEYTILEQAIAQLSPSLDLTLDVFDIINQEETLNYDIIVQGIKDLLQIILNWQGSEMKITLYDSNGNIYGEYQSANPPINIEIPNPTEGTWTCEITAVDVPHDNYPFALVVGISPNQAPVADANGPYSGSVDTPITFDASGSYDPDGEIATYEWDWDGDGIYDQSSNSATITRTWTEPYSGTIYLRVTDSEGATDTDNTSVEVILEITNQPPIAEAGPDQTVAAGADCMAAVTLDGSGSSDPDGDPLIYIWTWNGNFTIRFSPTTTIQLPLGTTTITLMVNDGTEGSEPDEVDITVEDTTPPATQIISPVSNQALQDGVILTADASDVCDVSEVYFYVREAEDGGSGNPIGYEDLPGAYSGTSWEYNFETNTPLTPDGYYVILTKAVDTSGNEGWSTPVPVSIRNWAVIELLPNTANNKAGRTMPVKFALRIAAAVDPAQPFVYNEELEIRIYDASEPNTILQTSLYGDTSKDYRINSVAELYITNFKTSKKPAEYVVEIWRMSKNFLVGSFTFETVK